ncbi:Xaa-Pro aminopeptidase [Elusimicrobium simillimum]|uniref:M24 family metallopeptidase n=1 Tax=Elusimicrobium simillimum TaxID=3143438 RepID=UPI003C6FCD6F
MNTENLHLFQKQLKKNGLDGYVITDYVEQLYLTGFHFSPEEAALLITQKEIYCFTRDLYVLELSNYAPFMHTSSPKDLNFPKAAAAQAKKLKIKKVAFNAAKTFYLDGKIFEKAKFKPNAFTVGKMREVKTKTELANMREAGRIIYKTYEHIKKYLKPGLTESQVAAEVERYVKTIGATRVSFRTIVAFGVNSNNTHHLPGDTKLKKEMPVLIDMGALYKDYCSDITRSWWYGSKPTEEYKKVWHIVDKARAAGVKNARPGITGKDLDLVPRGVITKAGYGEYFIHRTGHGIGIEVHELPNVESTNTGKFVQNNVISVEPGVYLPGKFGVRLEDSVVINKTGGIILTDK